jgi:hypothetical protein
MLLASHDGRGRAMSESVQIWQKRNHHRIAIAAYLYSTCRITRSGSWEADGVLSVPSGRIADHTPGPLVFRRTR